MLQSSLFRRAIALFALLFMVGVDVAARAEKPFIPYPAYGSSRGRIRYVDGVLRNKQRIHWGNGITDNGVLVMRDLAAAAGQILPVVLPRGAAGPEEEGQKPRGMPEAIDGKTDFQWQSDADGIRQANQDLLAKLTGKSPDKVEINPADPEKPVVGSNKGLRVLIIYEFKDKAEGRYSPEHIKVLDSSLVEQFLDANCAKDKDGTPEWREWDDDFTAEQIRDKGDEAWVSLFEDAIKDSGEKRPWLEIYRGDKKEGMELPMTVEETIQVLKGVGSP